ncbi:MAG: PQQ-binding-like beta-propeller repeat protein [Acidobacteriota bacterium]
MRCGIFIISVLMLGAAGLVHAADWPMFRGVNGSGVSVSETVPVEFGPSKNVVWKTALPFGHSSPVIVGDRIFLTGAEGGNVEASGRPQKVVDKGGKLFTFCLDRVSGKILWRREAPRPRIEQYQDVNSPASPSAASDGKSVFIFLADFGLLAYGLDGNELWRTPLGPFNNVNGHGSSPIVWKDLVVLVCDQDAGSYIVALDKKTGKQRWRVERPEVTRSYVTPAVYEPKAGPAELIVPGAYQVTSYRADTGDKLWWVRGFSWQPKSLPVIDGDMIYVHGWEGGGESETPTETPAWEEALKLYDKSGDGKITPNEVDEKMQRSFYLLDLDGKGYLAPRDWDFYRARRAARNTLLAIKHGGKGDVSQTGVVWRMQKFLPNVPSPLLYEGVLYLVKDGGILSAIDPKTGAVLKQGRLTGAVDTYYASPVGVAGKVILVSQSGVATVVKAGADWEIEATNDMDEQVFATPAVIDGRMYLRTRGALYCFERQ